MVSYATLANDLARFDGAETVTVIIKRANGRKEFSVAGVLRSGVGRKFSSFANLNVQADDVVFNVPDVNMNGEQLTNNDVIRDSNNVSYSVLAVDRPTFRTRWRCACRKVVGPV